MAMRGVLVASVAGLLFASAASSVVAEPPIGSRLGDRMQKSGRADDEATGALHGQEFARCLVNKRQRDTERLLAQSTEQGYNAAFKALTSGEIECFNMWDDATHITEGRSFRFPADILRGMLAEQLIKHDLPRYSALAPLPRQLTYSRAWYPGTQRDASVDEMATCVSETAPAETLALLKTEPYSPQEGAAFGALGPGLGACLRAGVKVTGNRQSLRAALADALYQRVTNPAPPIPAAPATQGTSH